MEHHKEVFAKAVELAPRFDRMAHLCRAVNAALGLAWSDAAWRGLLQRNPSDRERISKLLGTAAKSYGATIRIVGDVRGIVFSDIHAPFHDRQAITLAAKVAQWWKPNVAIWNGDNLDCYSISKYNKSPDRTERLQDEIDSWHIEVMAPLLAVLPPSPEPSRGENESLAAEEGKCIKVALPGNHEARLETLLWANPGLFGLRALDLPVLMELRRLGVEYARRKVLFDNLLEVSHGTKVRPQAGYTARAESEQRRYGISTITGHVHRAGSFMARTINGWVKAQEAPCLCQMTPEYAEDVDWVDWVQGVTLFEIRGGKLRIDPVEFFDGTAMVGRQYFAL